MSPFPSHEQQEEQTLTLGLEETTVLQVVFNDHICHCIKHKLDIFRVSCAGEVCVDLLCVASLVQVLKLALDVAGSFIVLVSTCREPMTTG